MIYNGVDLSPYVKANISRSVLPSISVSVDDIAGQHGARFKESKLGAREIPVTMRLRARRDTDMNEFRHMLASALYSDVPAPLILDDEPDKYYMAVLSGSSALDTLWHTGKAEVTFIAPRPWAYGAEKSESMSTSAALHVGGNWKTYPIVEAVPSKGASYRFENVDTGKYVQLNAPFDGTQKLVIDFDELRPRCTINGSAADRYVVLASSYFALEPGLNNIKASNGSTIVKWVEKWL